MENKEVKFKGNKEDLAFFNGLGEKERENLLNALAPEYRQVLIDFYEESKKISGLAKEEGLNAQALSVRRSRAISKMKELKEVEPFIVKGESSAIRYANKPFLLDARRKTEKYLEFLNLDKEVYPYLSDDEKYILNNFMLTFNEEEFKKLADTDAEAMAILRSRKISSIFDRFAAIGKRKCDVLDIYELLGGKENISDFAQFLNDNEKIIFKEYMLNIDPKANRHVIDNFGLKEEDIGYYKTPVKIKLNHYARERKRVSDLLKSLGGEEDVAAEFLPFLSEEEIDVFLSRFLDYHYHTEKDVYEKLGMTLSQYTSAKFSVQRKIIKYLSKKRELNNLLESAGGFENVFDRIADDLNAEEYYIFMNYTLVPYPVTVSKIADDLGRQSEFIKRVNIRLLKKINELVEERQKLKV